MTFKLTQNQTYANFLPRLLASLTDVLTVSLPIPTIVILFLVKSQSFSDLITHAIVVLTVVFLPFYALQFWYMIEMTHRFGGTAGKLLLGLQVTDEHGALLSRKMSFFRQHVVKPLSVASLLGFLAILFDPDHRAWHDHLAGTFVRRKGNRLLLGTIIVLVLIAGESLLVQQSIKTFQSNTALLNDIKNIQAQPTKNTPSLTTKSAGTTAVYTSTPIPSVVAQKWLIAAGGILAMRNQENLDSLKIQTPPQVLKPLLRDSWSIQNRRDALRTLSWLKVSGHSAWFNQVRTYLLTKTGGDPTVYASSKQSMLTELGLSNTPGNNFQLDFVWQHRDDLATKSLMAWDYARLINVSRWAYNAGYISEAEAWENIVFAGKHLQATYTSWDDMANNYVLGRNFWQTAVKNQDIQPSLNWLETNPSSPWQTISWNLSDVANSQGGLTLPTNCANLDCSVKTEVELYQLIKQLPDDFPVGIPVYPNSQVVQLGTSTTSHIVVFSVNKSDPVAIQNYYRDHLGAAGWILTNSSLQELIFSRSGSTIVIGTPAAYPIIFAIKYER